VNDHDLDFFDQIELLEIGAEMTKSDLYHHTWIGGVLAVAVPSRMITFRLGDLPFSWQDQF
jgi:hypothetical protein